MTERVISSRGDPMPTPRIAFVLASLLCSAALEAQTCVPHLLGADRRGPVAAISRTGSTLYVGTGAALLVVDVSNRANPVERGYVNLQGVVRDVAAAGTMAVVLTSSGLEFVDASDPDDPVATGSWPTPAEWNVRKIDARGTIAYVPEFAGVHFVDFANPANPEEIGFLALVGTKDVVTRSATRAYVSVYDYGGTGLLVVADVSNPLLPTVVTTTPLSGVGSAALAIGPNGGRLAAWHDHPSHHPWSELSLFDLSDPDHPAQHSFMSFEALLGVVSIAGDRAYLGRWVFGISNPSQPQWLGELPEDVYLVAHATTGNPNLLYVADWRRGVVTFDVSDPGATTELDLTSLPGNSLSSYLEGSNAIVLDDFGVRVVGLENPNRPTPVGDLRLTTSYLSRLSRISADRAILAGSFDAPLPQTARFVDLTDPEHPALRNPFDGVEDRWDIDSGLLYAPADPWCPEALTIYDISDPEEVSAVGQVDLGAGCWGYAATADGNRLYVWHRVDHEPEPLPLLSVFEVSVPASPVELATSDFDYDSWGTPNAHGRQVTLTRHDGLDVYDLTAPGAPVLRGSIPSARFHGRRPALYGSRAGIPRFLPPVGASYGENRVSLLDLADSAEPAEIALLDTPGSVEGVDLGPGVVVVADGAAGFSIFESCIPFADGFESGDTSEWSLLAP